MVLLHGVQSGSSTWWRVGRDLADLGVPTTAVDLPGHGGRAVSPAGSRTIGGLADEVAECFSGSAVVVGHSLGALVALELAARHPQQVAALVLEDPPSLGGGLDPLDVAGDLQGDAERARQAPVSEADVLLAVHPLWARADAEHVVANRAAMDVDAALELFRAERWDLAAMVAAAAVPVTLLAATPPGSALVEPDRATLLAALGEHAVVIESGHGIHRDRPALWLHAVLRVVHGRLPSAVGRPGAATKEEP